MPARLPRRPERRLGLVEAIGHAAGRAGGPDAFPCYGLALCSGSSFKVSLFIMPVNLNGIAAKYARIRTTIDTDF
jgi:hypothetical protein